MTLNGLPGLWMTKQKLKKIFEFVNDVAFYFTVGIYLMFAVSIAIEVPPVGIAALIFGILSAISNRRKKK